VRGLLSTDTQPTPVESRIGTKRGFGVAPRGSALVERSREIGVGQRARRPPGQRSEGCYQQIHGLQLQSTNTRPTQQTNTPTAHTHTHTAPPRLPERRIKDERLQSIHTRPMTHTHTPKLKTHTATHPPHIEVNFMLTRGSDRCFVDQIGKLGPAQPGRIGLTPSIYLSICLPMDPSESKGGGVVA